MLTSQHRGIKVGHSGLTVYLQRVHIMFQNNTKKPEELHSITPMGLVYMYLTHPKAIDRISALVTIELSNR